MITDGPSGRNPATALRDLLRFLDRDANASHPARPSEPPVMALARFAPTLAPALTVAIGDWVLSQDPDTGDLIATHATTGTVTTVAVTGGS